MNELAKSIYNLDHLFMINNRKTVMLLSHKQILDDISMVLLFETLKDQGVIFTVSFRGGGGGAKPIPFSSKS